ncbi:MAG: LPXTG cell wall anchor domain-containing protein [Chloroflexi bacterium SZAS-1]|jgi:LPXTG-motif cell wall-anchored protein|nr:LPXTG cell wall anchor domain-containing protein [Chloroflexi bacterium SZAS-1]HNP87980.1 LPXTG cell wall anchor domain-containing protein [Kouleothrix sp.]
MVRKIRTVGLFVGMLALLALAPAVGAAPARQATGKVTASDQPIANNTITVANVTAGQDGWIVAHLDEGGQPGKVLGETAVKKGENPNVKITLSEAVPVGGKLWPMLHIDAGKIGTYEFPGADSPVIAANGKPEMVQITVTAAAAAATPAPTTTAPGNLPKTGGETSGAGLLAGALLLVLAGALVLGRARRA